MRPRTGWPDSAGSSHAGLASGSGQRREGVAARHHRASEIEHQQQFVARVALPVVGEEVANRGAVGAHQREQLRERRQQPRHEREPLVAAVSRRGQRVAAAHEVGGHAFGDRLVGQPPHVGERGPGERR